MPISWNAFREQGAPNNAQDLQQTSEQRTSETAAFIPRQPIYGLADVILNGEVKEQIRILKSRIENHKLLYEGWGLKKIDPQGTHVAVSFYGPPGTGKTMCAEGLASELGKKIIEVSYAEIESRWVGETGKNIRKAFKTARNADSLLFFDEADAILGARMSNVTQAADHAVNVARAVMLKELDAFDGVVVFATNEFGKYDRAFLRRILHHIEIPLPDRKTRVELWKHLVVETIPGRDALDWEKLADESENMSGGDIKNCVILACSETLLERTENQKIQLTSLLKSIEKHKKTTINHEMRPFDVKS